MYIPTIGKIMIKKWQPYRWNRWI